VSNNIDRLRNSLDDRVIQQQTPAPFTKATNTTSLLQINF